jgi:hypothetical protein
MAKNTLISRHRNRSQPCTALRSRCLRSSRLLLFRGWNNRARRFAGKERSHDDNNHFRRCHQQQQHQFVQGNLQWKTQEPERMQHQGNGWYCRRVL